MYDKEVKVHIEKNKGVFIGAGDRRMINWSEPHFPANKTNYNKCNYQDQYSF
jgi:hypothetical protein